MLSELAVCLVFGYAFLKKNKAVIVCITHEQENPDQLVTTSMYNVIVTTFEPLHEKTNVLVSDLVRHKPGYTATKDG